MVTISDYAVICNMICLKLCNINNIVEILITSIDLPCNL